MLSSWVRVGPNHWSVCAIVHSLDLNVPLQLWRLRGSSGTALHNNNDQGSVPIRFPKRQNAAVVAAGWEKGSVTLNGGSPLRICFVPLSKCRKVTLGQLDIRRHSACICKQLLVNKVPAERGFCSLVYGSDSFNQAKPAAVTTLSTAPSHWEHFSVHLPALVCGSSPDRGAQALPTSAWVPASSGPQSQHGSDLRVPPPLTGEKYFHCDVWNSYVGFFQKYVMQKDGKCVCAVLAMLCLRKNLDDWKLYFHSYENNVNLNELFATLAAL